MNSETPLINKSAIIAIGTAIPKYMRAQIDTANILSLGLNLKPAEVRLLKSICKATGIENRYSVLSDYCKQPNEFEFFPTTADRSFPTTKARMQIYQEHALDLALLAIENCLSSVKNFLKTDISHLIIVSCTGMYAPGIDIGIINKLNLNSSVKRTAINFMGCYGAFNAIRVADAICQSDKNASVLIVCVELCTIHLQKSSSLDNIIANSIFADGSGAMLIQSSNPQNQYFTLENFHNELLPQSEQAMAWHIGDYGFDIILSQYVADLVESGIAHFTRDLLIKHGLHLSDVDYFAIHPGGIKILQACEKALNIHKDDNRYAYQILHQYGNMSSATIVFVLKAIWDDLYDTDNQKNIFSCAFGPGLTLESMLLKIHGVPRRSTAALT